MLLIHIAGALLTLIYAGYSTLRKTSHVSELLFAIKSLAALTVAQIITGVMLAIQINQNATATCVQLGVYVAIIVAAQAVLFVRAKALRTSLSVQEVE